MENNILILSKDLYSKIPLQNAISMFTSLCQIEVIENDKEWKCIFYQCKADAELTKKEFENYLIGRVRQIEY